MELTLAILTLLSALLAAAAAVYLALRPQSTTTVSRRDVEEVVNPIPHSIGALKTLLDATRTDVGASRDSLRNFLDGQSDRHQKNAMDANASFQAFQDNFRALLGTSLDKIQTSTEAKLNEIRGVVDEKLTTTLSTKLSENFDQLGKLLSNVQSGLGQVQALATDVSGLRKSFDGVKTRGIFGEVLLRALLADFLHHTQFVEQFKPSARSKETVEFAIKLPGRHPEDPDDAVYLPIDAKYPKESYDRLIDALEAGDKDAATEARKELLTSIRNSAREIQTKYISPPDAGESGGTTDFAILYLPMESLFAEVAREPGLLYEIQSKYKVTIASPTTLAALLSALQVGFQTLKIQRDHAEIGKLLSVVRGEFQKFSKALDKVEVKLSETQKALTDTKDRTRQMDRKLKSITAVDATNADQLPAVAEDHDDESDPELTVTGLER